VLKWRFPGRRLAAPTWEESVRVVFDVRLAPERHECGHHFGKVARRASCKAAFVRWAGGGSTSDCGLMGLATAPFFSHVTRICLFEAGHGAGMAALVSAPPCWRKSQSWKSARGRSDGPSQAKKNADSLSRSRACRTLVKCVFMFRSSVASVPISKDVPIKPGAPRTASTAYPAKAILASALK
jgi:hypothetical protein